MSCVSVLTTIDRGSTGSRGSFDPPLLEVGGQAMLFDPPLALAIFCFLALDRRSCPIIIVTVISLQLT